MRRDEPELSGTLTPTSRAWLRHHTREARTPISAEEESAIRFVCAHCLGLCPVFGGRGKGSELGLGSVKALVCPDPL